MVIFSFFIKGLYGKLVMFHVQKHLYIDALKTFIDTLLNTCI